MRKEKRGKPVGVCPQDCGESMVVTHLAACMLSCLQTRRLKMLPRALDAGQGLSSLVLLHSSSPSPPVKLHKDPFVQQYWTLLKTKALSGKDLEVCLSFHTSPPSVLSLSLPAWQLCSYPVPYSSLLVDLTSKVSILSPSCYFCVHHLF